MRERQDTIARRLDRLFRAKRQSPSSAFFDKIVEQLPEGWEYTRGRSLLAELALDFDLSGPHHRPLALAFKGAGLDPRNPLHWRLLIEYFAWAHFGHFKSGKPRTESKIVAAVRKDLAKLPTSLSNTEVAKELKKKYGLSERTLRAYVSKARKPNKPAVRPEPDISEIIDTIKSEIELQALMAHSVAGD